MIRTGVSHFEKQYIEWKKEANEYESDKEMVKGSLKNFRSKNNLDYNFCCTGTFTFKYENTVGLILNV